MMAKEDQNGEKPGKNGFQRIHRGERRIRWSEVQHYLKLADSEDPKSGWEL